MIVMAFLKSIALLTHVSVAPTPDDTARVDHYAALGSLAGNFRRSDLEAFFNTRDALSFPHAFVSHCPDTLLHQTEADFTAYLNRMSCHTHRKLDVFGPERAQGQVIPETYGQELYERASRPGVPA